MGGSGRVQGELENLHGPFKDSEIVSSYTRYESRAQRTELTEITQELTYMHRPGNLPLRRSLRSNQAPLCLEHPCHDRSLCLDDDLCFWRSHCSCPASGCRWSSDPSCKDLRTGLPPICRNSQIRPMRLTMGLQDAPLLHYLHPKKGSNRP